MLSAQTLDLAFAKDPDWTPQIPVKLHRSTSSVSSWGVTSIGRGFEWDEADGSDTSSSKENEAPPILAIASSASSDTPTRKTPTAPSPRTPHIFDQALKQTSLSSPSTDNNFYFAQPVSLSASPLTTPSTSFVSHRGSMTRSSTPSSPQTRPPTPRARRRSSQQRVSLIAGRVSIAPIEPSSPVIVQPMLQRVGSAASYLSSAASTRAPSPSQQSFLGSHTINDYHIEGEVGRGAYGLVKRVRELEQDGSLGPPLILKQIIKSRILADCWKKHPKLGTIPIEIYVMSAISNTSYVLPSPRPWDPSRPSYIDPVDTTPSKQQEWIEGKVIKGHPNICPLLDFFEDNHYYYLVLPYTTPEQKPSDSPPPSDLFDLVEAFPTGLPPRSIRTYLGQLADALCFLHSHGIVHRDVKDENVVLGANGKCILIDFGSSGLVKKTGWDTFSGTLDYAGPEILRGERYFGKEQDVWAFGVVAYVLLVGECPFMTAAEAQEGLESPFASASIALDERCGEGKENEGEESDGGGALGDAAALVRACLQLEVTARPTFEKIMECRFLAGKDGWGTHTEEA